jgi:flagellar assembly protein FliH
MGDAVEINPGVVTALIRAGFAGATLSTKGEITVRVSAQDYEEVAAHKDEIMALVGGAAELSILQDMSLAPTDCLIDTPYGRIDCSLKPQYKALRENLVYLLSQKNQEQPGW